MEITSLENQLVKKITSLHKKKFRDEYKLFFIEGMKSIKEAINFNQEIEYVLYSPDMIYYDLDIEGIEVSKEILCKISDTVTPQGIVAVCKIKEEKIDVLKGKKKIVYLDKVQDPGNVGTIIRTADAFGIDGVVLSKECADIYSPKVVRSTMGSIFHLPVIRDVNVEELKKLNMKIYSSSLNGNEEFKIEDNSILVIGNEGNGISDETKEITDEFIKIKMPGNAESLNASIAAGILMYEFTKWEINGA